MGLSIALQLIGLGALTGCLCLPLIWRKVPMNRFYGVRIRDAFTSKERWYDINAHGGRLLARWSLVIIVAGVAGFFVPPPYFRSYAWIADAIVLVSLLVPLIQVLRWAKATRRS